MRQILKTGAHRSILAARQRYIAWRYNRKIRRLAQRLDRPDPELLSTHRKLWGPISPFRIHPGWLNWYSHTSGMETTEFVPESTYYAIIEPALNDLNTTSAWADKNSYDLIYGHGLFPNSIIRCIHGSFFDRNYEPLELTSQIRLLDQLQPFSEIVIKPSVGSDGGRNIRFFYRNGDRWQDQDGQKLSLEALIRAYGSDFVVQEKLTQHPFFDQFNPSSLNSIRVMTLRLPQHSHSRILHSVLRVGPQGAKVDNNSLPGSFCIGMDHDGRLNSHATDLQGQRFDQVNGLELSKPMQCHEFSKVCEAAIQIADKQFRHRMLGIDMTVDASGTPRCVEINNRYTGITLPQNNNGPLFGSLTNEVVDFCRQHSSAAR